MARARMIKPGFFTNEELPDLPAHTRLFFIGLWTIADREGRLEDRPRKIKAEIFPHENIEIEPMLCSLGEKGFLQRYSVDGSAYIQIVNFQKHQRPHHNESESIIPEPPKDFPRSKALSTKDESASAFNIDTRTLNIDSLNDDADVPPAKKQAPSASQEKTPRKKPETFVPDDFPLEDRHYTYAGKKGLNKTETERETEKFLLWHGSKQTRYSDWFKAWQGWILKAAENKANLTPFQKSAPEPEAAPNPLVDYENFHKLRRLKARTFDVYEIDEYTSEGGEERYQADLAKYTALVEGKRGAA